MFIEPVRPRANGYVESFNGKLRDELLDREIFYTLKEAQVLIEDWRKFYNQVRRHSALGYRPPVPVTYLDFLSMYPTLNVLLGNWRFLIAQRIDTKSDLRSVRRFLQNVTLDDMLKPETWRDLHMLVRVRSEGDVLPVRAMYGKRNDY